MKTAIIALLAASVAALPAIQAVGGQSAGGTDIASAPQLEAGAWQDRLPADSARYYKLPTPVEGESHTVTAQLLIDPMIEPSSTGFIRLETKLLRADGAQCEFEGSTTTERAAMDRLALASLRTGSPGKATGCYAQGNQDVFLEVVRSGEWQADTEIPLQLNVVKEPAVDATTLSGQVPQDLPPTTVDVDAPAQPVSGGSSFLNAAELAGTSVSSDQLLPLETKYYKVHLAEGQRLNYRVTMSDSRDASATTLVAQEFSPTLGDDVSAQSRSELKREDVGASITRSTRTEVSRDLFDTNGARGELRNPGYYYIALTGSARDPRGLNPLKYELAVQVTGEAKNADAFEPQLSAAEANTIGSTSQQGWPPSSAQLGALLGGAAVALAGFAAGWIIRRRRS